MPHPIAMAWFACSPEPPAPDPVVGIGTEVRVPRADPLLEPIHGQARVPRILLVTLDTTRADHLGAWGDERRLTPALDRFAEGALRFDRAHAHAPWTKPSVATLMTSVLPKDHGLWDWEDQLPDDRITLARALDAAGWRTEAIVSHVAFDPAYNRFHLGFDDFRLSWLDQPGGGVPRDSETSEHLTDLALEALQRLRQADTPSLLWVHYIDPHNDYLHHDAFLDLGDDPPSAYAEEIAWMDHQLGRLLDVAAADPELVVALLADHGEEWQDHGGLGHAHTVYQELIHVPLILRVPGVEPGVVDVPVGTLDVAPTLLDLVGLPVPDGFHGRPLVPQPDVRPLFAETRRIGDARSVIHWPYKLVWDLQEGRGELYQLDEDPREQVDLWSVHPRVARRLLERLVREYPEIGDVPGLGAPP